MNRTLLVQTICPDYRLGLFDALKVRFGSAFTFACGEASFSPTLRTPQAAWRTVDVRVTNSFWFGRRLLWQHPLCEIATGFDLVIAEFNLRAPSTWLLLWQRRHVGRPTIFWGHSAGSRSMSEPVRRWMIRHAAGFVAYMPAERRRLQASFPGLPVWVAPNAMMWARDCRFVPRPTEELADVIYVGRLVAKKKVGLLLDGFAEAVRRDLLPATSRLVLVGDGPERFLLENRARAYGLAERVVFLGHVGNVDRLRELYSRSLVAVSPGYVGLAVTQALSFGVVVLVADNEPHSPEIELCEAGDNAVFFRAEDPADLARGLGDIARNRQMWAARRSLICDTIRGSYTFDRMVETFAQLMTMSSVNGIR